jgi:hypothetical protein
VVFTLLQFGRSDWLTPLQFVSNRSNWLKLVRRLTLLLLVSPSVVVGLWMLSSLLQYIGFPLPIGRARR